MSTEPGTEVTTASEWKKKAAGEELELPSGNVALVRRPGLAAFVKGGRIPNGLNSLIQSAIGGDTQATHQGVVEALNDPSKLADLFDLMNSVVIGAVVQPPVKPVPSFTEKHVEEGLCSEEEVGEEIPLGHPARSDDVIYVDEVDEDDKQFIFNFAVGGTRDLERFREQQRELVADVQPGQAVEGATKLPSRDQD